jgi:hypothetical protein
VPIILFSGTERFPRIFNAQAGKVLSKPDRVDSLTLRHSRNTWQSTSWIRCFQTGFAEFTILQKEQIFLYMKFKSYRYLCYSIYGTHTAHVQIGLKVFFYATDTLEMEICLFTLLTIEHNMKVQDVLKLKNLCYNSLYFLMHIWHLRLLFFFV